MDSSIKIQFPSLIENIRIVESFIDNAKDKYNISDDLYGNIMVAVTESVNNAIVHGNQLQKEKKVNLTLHFDNNLITFEIEDEGNGFEYDNLPDPTSPENLETPKGRGVFLMQNLCDEVHFKNDGRLTHLVFYIN